MESIRDRLPAGRRLAIVVKGIGAATAALVVGGLLYAATVFQPDIQPTGWVAPPRLSTVDLSTDGGVMYRAYFDRQNWTGNLFALPVDSAGNIDWQNQKWKKGNAEGAAAVLDGMNWNTERNIVTLNDTHRCGQARPVRQDLLGIPHQTRVVARRFRPRRCLRHVARQGIAARDIDQRQRGEFQAACGASRTAIKEGAEAVRLLPALGHEGGILHFNPFVGLAPDALERQAMPGRPVKRSAELALDRAFTVVTVAT